MPLFNHWQRSRYIMQWLLINVVAWLAYLSAVAVAQLEWSEAVYGSVSFPNIGLACIGNFSVFITALMRGRLDMENGARDVLATTRGPELNAINDYGLTTCHTGWVRYAHVVMLSKYKQNQKPHSSITQFMRYISNSHDLDSIVLQSLPLKSAAVTPEIRRCEHEGECKCIVFRPTEEILKMLARRLPRTLKRLSESQCLLPSLRCLRGGCHGCNQGLLYVEEHQEVEAAGESSERGNPAGILREGGPTVESPAAVCLLMETDPIQEESNCICIPVYPGGIDDEWTKFLIKFLKSKDKEGRGIKVMASYVLENYMDQISQEWPPVLKRWISDGVILAPQTYGTASLILPRLAEVFVNMVLTGWLRVDGFSSSLVARRAIRDYVVDSEGTGFAATAFLSEALVCCADNKKNVCQTLRFRGVGLRVRSVSYMVGFVNLICSITWSVLIAFEGKWYAAHSMPPSTPTVSVIIGAIGVALAMDGFQLCMLRRPKRRAHYPDRVRARALARDLVLDRDLALVGDRDLALDLDPDLGRGRGRGRALICVGIMLEIGCIVTCSVCLGMQRVIGRWTYSMIQVLVWVKWGIGSFLLGDVALENEFGNELAPIQGRSHGGAKLNFGTWVYCSALLLNAVLAGVRGKWTY